MNRSRRQTADEEALDLAVELGVRPSARVKRVAEMLDTEISTVYRLVHTGALQGHRLGKRGIRVYLDSIKAYQDRQRCDPEVQPSAAPVKRRIHDRSYQQAVSTLRAAGILPLQDGKTWRRR